MSFGSLVDGLAVVEDLCALPTARVQACMPPHVPVPKPGPCPGRKGLPGTKTAKAKPRPAVKKAAAKAPAAPPPAEVAAVSARDLFAPAGQKTMTPVTDPAKLAALGSAYEVNHAGMTSTVDTVTARDDKVAVSGTISSPDGEPIGNFKIEIFLDRRGGMYADIGLLAIHSRFQGQGFAKRFLDQQISWYREQGFDRAQLLANIDVGARAWARAGWDWGSPFDAAVLQDRLRTMTKGKDQRAARLAEEMLARFDAATFGSPGYPTPFELSEMGREEGQGKDDTWPGVALFASHPDVEHPDHLGWNAELRFSRPVPVAASAARDGRTAMVEALHAVHGDWVGRHLDGTRFEARPDSKDFNLYYVDVDAAGDAQDDLAVRMHAVLDAARAGTVTGR